MVVKTRCVVCGTRFRQAARGRSRLYCSDACRMVAYRARLRKRQLATRPEAGCDPLPLDGAEIADLDTIIEALERERRAMDSRELSSARLTGILPLSPAANSLQPTLSTPIALGLGERKALQYRVRTSPKTALSARA